MSGDTFVHFFVGAHEHGPQTFVGLEIWQSVLEHKSGFCKMQWVQEYASKGSSGKVSHEGVPFEYVVSKVEIVLRVIPQDLIEQHMSTPATIPLVEAKHSLLV